MKILEHLLNTSHINNKKVYTSEIAFWKKEYLDDNIFFTALIAYTLKDLKSTFSTKDQNKIDLILQNSLYAFSFFENKHGDLSYSFYPTKPLNQYSGIKFLNKFKALHIPDDLDSTSLVYLAKPTELNSKYQELKESFEALSYDGKPLKSIPKSFQSTKAYRTWFATKMNHDMDICVMCNVLTLVYQNNLSFKQTDEDTIQFISKLIDENRLLNQAYLFSPHYKNKAIVLYHIARLISISNHPNILRHQNKIIDYCLTLINEVKHPMEKVILTSALYKVNCQKEFDIEMHISDFNNFFWFKANPFSISPPIVKKIFSQKKFLHLEYKCEAYYWVLLLELKQISNASLSINNNAIRLFK